MNGSPARWVSLWVAAVLAAGLAACGGGAGAGARAGAAAVGEPGASHAAVGPPVPLTPPPAGRLTGDVIPRRGAVDVSLDPRRPDFHGRVSFEVDVRRPVTVIWLNARGLAIDRAVLGRGSGDAVLPLAPVAPPASAHTLGDLVGLAAHRRLRPGPARLTIEYHGRLRDKTGLFRQKQDGRWYAFTDFEPIDARAAMPCFDDPRFKLPWQVTLEVPDGQRAFSNTPPAKVTPAGRGVRRIEFAPTARLPSYLVAWVVGPFDVVPAAKAPVPVRIIVPRGLTPGTWDAVATAPRLLALLEDYLGSPTPFPKLDLVAVPTFNGAMENPGLITVHAGILLTPPALRGTGVGREQHVLLAAVLAHELSHLWFGDLVTTDYWDQLWLNEGMATWMSGLLLARLEPALARQVIDLADKDDAVQRDRRPAPRRMRAPIRGPADFDTAFDAMTYKKGGALADMFAAYLGPARMRSALQAYLAAHRRGTVTSRDMAAAWSAQAGRDLWPALESFLDQPGIPVVAAALSCAAGRAPSVSLAQSPYAALGAGQAAAARRWGIPVCVSFDGGAAPVCTLLDGARADLTLPLPASRCPSWIHPNPGERGYYLYSLPPAQLRALATRAPLTPREQAGLVSDLDALLAAGRVRLAPALDALGALARSRDHLVAARTSSILALLARSVIGPGQRRGFAAYLDRDWGPLARQLGFSPASSSESNLDGQLRAAIVPLVGADGADPVLQREALRRLEARLARPAADPPDDDSRAAAAERLERDLLYQIAPALGGKTLMDRLLARNDGRVGRAVGGFRRPDLVRLVLAGLDKDGVSPVAGLQLLRELLSDGATQDLALPAALDHFGAFASRLADTDRPRAALVFASVCRAAARPRIAAALHALLGDHPSGPAARLPGLVLEAIDACAAFRTHYRAQAAAYFK